MPAVVNGETCNACTGRERQECISACPYEAISLVGGKAFVEKEKCDDCKVCVEACPVNAISLA